MRDKIFGLLVALYVIGIPITTGYFYNRPMCTWGNATNTDMAVCGGFAAALWPLTFPANISVRVFSP